MQDPSTPYPLEVLVDGVPLSLQASAPSRAAWIAKVRAASLKRRDETTELAFLDERPLSVTIFYFCAAPMEGDIDNIIKPILDGLIGAAYLDDAVVERVTAQKCEPDVDWQFTGPSEQLASVLDRDPPAVYIRVDDDLSWRVRDGHQ
ncbi:MAG: uncharacterized protein JWQ22_3310 [Devosia sp.]|nr:uncharacterized protein [Devosia sp.]